MRSSLVVRGRLTANASVATVLGSIPASVGTVEFEGRQMKQCYILYGKKRKNPLKKYLKKNIHTGTYINKHTYILFPI